MGVGASGFQNFFLKEELMKAISECGFEHPSEGRSPSPPFIHSSESVHSQGPHEGRYSLSGAFWNGKDVCVCHFHSSEH